MFDTVSQSLLKQIADRDAASIRFYELGHRDAETVQAVKERDELVQQLTDHQKGIRI